VEKRSKADSSDTATLDQSAALAVLVKLSAFAMLADKTAYRTKLNE